MHAIPHILLVEDNSTARFLIRALLEKHLQAENEGTSIAIVEVENGQEAVDVILESQEMPVLILLDINMPVMGGFEFLEWATKKGMRANMDVFILSSSTAPEDHTRAEELGVSVYLSKPLGLDKVKYVADYVKSKLIAKHHTK